MGCPLVVPGLAVAVGLHAALQLHTLCIGKAKHPLRLQLLGARATRIGEPSGIVLHRAVVVVRVELNAIAHERLHERTAIAQANAAGFHRRFKRAFEAGGFARVSAKLPQSSTLGGDATRGGAGAKSHLLQFDIQARKAVGKAYEFAERLLESANGDPRTACGHDHAVERLNHLLVALTRPQEFAYLERDFTQLAQAGFVDAFAEYLFVGLVGEPPSFAKFAQFLHHHRERFGFGATRLGKPVHLIGKPLFDKLKLFNGVVLRRQPKIYFSVILLFCHRVASAITSQTLRLSKPREGLRFRRLHNAVIRKFAVYISKLKDIRRGDKPAVGTEVQAQRPVDEPAVGDNDPAVRTIPEQDARHEIVAGGERTRGIEGVFQAAVRSRTRNDGKHDANRAADDTGNELSVEVDARRRDRPADNAHRVGVGRPVLRLENHRGARRHAPVAVGFAQGDDNLR